METSGYMETEMNREILEGKVNYVIGNFNGAYDDLELLEEYIGKEFDSSTEEEAEGNGGRQMNDLLRVIEEAKSTAWDTIRTLGDISDSVAGVGR